MKITSIVWSVVLLLAVGCRSIGPHTVARDRFDYSHSIGESWKRQTLLNIVKLRYFDPPIFVDVGQIVAGYTLESTVSVGGTFERGADSLGLGGSGKYTDRPTITYTPLIGNKFVKSLMTPLPPEAVFFTIQSGWPADSVLGATVASINGLKNQDVSIDGVSQPNAQFLRVLELLRQVQISGAVSLRVQQDPQKRHTSILTFRTENISEATLQQIAELRRILKLDPSATEFQLVFAAASTNNMELAVITRSMLHIMGMMSAQVDVPAEDIAQGRATAGAPPSALRIRSSKKRPADTFVGVAYRDQWYWIDDRDLQTKRQFAFMMMLFTLADTGENERMPLITIPAQ
jgi:hypothetical protein